MELKNKSARFFVPDGKELDIALNRTTHLAVAAHQDDIEIMAIEGILECYLKSDQWFSGVVMTNGAGSPRSGIYKDFTDEEIRKIRTDEQLKAAIIGDYSVQFLLDYSSSQIKKSSETHSEEDLKSIFKSSKADIIYTHNLADKHATHIAVAIKTINALRTLPEVYHPDRLYGCEVWRDLGWMLDEDKIIFDCSEKENLQAALLGVFDSQISGGKRYDLATMGRRRANATYYASHDVDISTGMAFGMDLTPLIKDPTRDIFKYVKTYIDRFSDDVKDMISNMD
jgi:LmbE family N-acetylglucosaminyl deacetylase